MSGPFSSDEMQWLHKAISPYIPAPAAMFLGGSRGGFSGQPVSSSDNDVIIMAAHVPQPASLTLQSPVSGNMFDLILRDPDSLAYEIEGARKGGNGTLLHICAHSQVLLDENGMGTKVQRRAQQLHAEGPYALALPSLKAEVAERLIDIKMIEHECDSDVRNMAAQSLTHRFGHLALRAQKHWTANGKVLARDLARHLPEFKAKTEAAGMEFACGNSAPLKAVAQDIIDLHVAGTPAVSLSQTYNLPARPNLAEVYTYSRLSSTALHAYLESDKPSVRAAAQDWVHYYFNLTAGAVDPERLSRPHGEYRYALARYGNMLMDMACLATEVDPQSRRLNQRIHLLKLFGLGVVEAMDAAQEGKPEALHKAANKLLNRIVPQPHERQPRPMPQNYRLPAENLGLI